MSKIMTKNPSWKNHIATLGQACDTSCNKVKINNLGDIWCKSSVIQRPGGGALPAEVAADQVRHRAGVGRPPRGLGRDDKVRKNAKLYYYSINHGDALS